MVCEPIQKIGIVNDAVQLLTFFLD
jgi:hypothetical protein